MKEGFGVIYNGYLEKNRKPYIGQAINLERRKKDHKARAKEGSTGFHGAIFKHGWDAFAWEVLEVCPVEDLNDREVFWISALDTFKGFGYNRTPGGDGNGRGEDSPHYGKIPWNKGIEWHEMKGENNPFYGKTHTDETKKNISNKMKGKEAWNKGKSAPQCGKKGKDHPMYRITGENHPRYGQTHTDKTKQKMIKSQRLRRINEITQKDLDRGQMNFLENLNTEAEYEVN